MNFASWKKDKIVYSLIIAYIVIFIFLLLYKYFSFQLDWSYDLGVQNQILWKLANEGSFRSTIYLSYPPRWIILFFILPAYLLYQSPVTLLILKAILFGAAAVPLYRLSKLLKLAPPYQYLVVFSYLFNIGVIRTLLNDFFPDSLALPLLIFSFYFMYTRRTMHFLLFSFLALSCRAEIYGIYIAIFATWFIIKDRSNIRFAMLAFIILVMFSLLNPYILQDASHKRLYFTNTIKEILLPGSLD
ncbi:MAG: DUF2079 domain-containing protein, partial [Nanoarchaeota archaeon]|nr:DUF2079 domain-containing protein [Nanoarchaeota archaeon]